MQRSKGNAVNRLKILRFLLSDVSKGYHDISEGTL